MVLVAHPDTGIRNLAGIEDWIRLHGGISIAHAPLGSASHACAVLLNSKLLNGKAQLVSYGGGAHAMRAALQATNQLLCDQSTLLLGQLQSRQLGGVAVVSSERLGQFYDVSTSLEQGADNLMAYWGGLFAPSSTPPAVIYKIASALQSAVRDPDLRRSLAELGVLPTSADQATPEFLTAQIQKDIQRHRSHFSR